MTREDAIEIMRKNMPSDKSLPVYEALQTLIPELAESENERMYARVTGRYTRFEKYYLRALGETEANKVLKQCEEEELWIKNLLEKQKESLHIQETCKENPNSFTNEDEKIRKAIIKSIEEDSSVYEQEVSKEQMLDWLEKQKEQKPAYTAKERWKEMRLEVYAQASGNRHEPNYSDDSTKMFSLCDIDEIFEKIGDSTIGSKPAEWSEEDEKIMEDIIFAIRGVWKEEYANRMIAKLKSLRPQPPKEWAIEDAKPGDILHTSSTASSNTFIFKGIRNDEHGSVECFCCYDSEDGFRKGGEEFIGWKTDKYRLATPEQCIELGRRMGRAGYIFGFETNQLQKLNEPHWKPSKEQMKALKETAEWKRYSNPQIFSLYEDLKKLM